MALFVPDVEYGIAWAFIEYLRNCYPAVRDQVGLLHHPVCLLIYTLT